MSHVSPGGLSDSADVPWAGRTFEPSPFASDDGTRSLQVKQCLDALAAADDDGLAGALADLVDALVAHRLLVPVVAHHGADGDVRVGPTGVQLVADKSADVAMVATVGPDGRPCLPVFSSTDAMREWNPDARPIPVNTRQAMLSAIEQDLQTLWLDPASAHACVIPRPAVWAAAQGHRWVPFLDNAKAVAGVREALENVTGVLAVRCDPDPSGQREIVVSLGISTDATAEQRESVAHAAATTLAHCAYAEAIDSLRLRLLPYR